MSLKGGRGCLINEDSGMRIVLRRNRQQFCFVSFFKWHQNIIDNVFSSIKERKGNDTQSKVSTCQIQRDVENFRRRESDLHISPSISLCFQHTYVKPKERARDLVKTDRPIYLLCPTSSLLLAVFSGSDRWEQRVYRWEISCYSFVPREPTRRTLTTLNVYLL